MISKLSAESTIGVGLPSSTVCSSVSFPCIVARVSKSVFHRLLLLLFLPSLHVQPSSELYPSIKLAITPPSIHPFIQLPVGAAWGRVLVGCCRPPPLPLLSCLLSPQLDSLFLVLMPPPPPPPPPLSLPPQNWPPPYCHPPTALPAGCRGEAAFS